MCYVTFERSETHILRRQRQNALRTIVLILEVLLGETDARQAGRWGLAVVTAIPSMCGMTHSKACELTDIKPIAAQPT
jgi:hypothetical protein